MELSPTKTFNVNLSSADARLESSSFTMELLHQSVPFVDGQGAQNLSTASNGFIASRLGTNTPHPPPFALANGGYAYKIFSNLLVRKYFVGVS